MSLSRLRREAKKAYSDPALISHGDVKVSISLSRSLYCIFCVSCSAASIATRKFRIMNVVVHYGHMSGAIYRIQCVALLALAGFGCALGLLYP